ncbi:MAG: hypothetical protein C0501_11240 [Isosphaera sp.]|nr:hypothetical protein [Isosphaera sp.]
MTPTARRPFAPRLERLDDRALPSTFTVLNLNDAGAGSLRAAVAAANANPGADTIVFRPGLAGTIRLTSGQLTLTDDVTIDGPGSPRLAVSGNDRSRVFEVRGAGTDVVIDGLHITRGRADGQAPTLASTGGGILSQGNLTLTDVLVSRNRAVGDAGVVVPISAALNMAGAAVGGGVASFGTLTVMRSTFTANEAVGADDADSSGFSFPARAFAGTAFGGALGNFGTATISESTFTDNQALAGSRGRGDFAAIASGGAILNDATLTISGSTFRRNRAVGGDDAVSPFHNGHALGGAILSGSLLPAVDPNGRSGDLTVRTSTFEHNEAVGGSGNRVTLPLDQVPPADAPNNAYGGAITVFQGTGVIRQTVVRNNRAVAGIGGAEQKGSLGVGGGVFFFNFLGGATGAVEGSVITGNEAVGGRGRDGGRGGDGLGGGLAAGGLGSPFGAPGAVTVSDTVVFNNLARGGDGGRGGAGGDGLGGGVYVDADNTLTGTADLITLNRARGGEGRGGGDDGRGVGGGVYNLGTFADTLTLIVLNQASTSDDDFFGF